MQIVIDIPKKTFNEIREHNITHCGEPFAQKLVRYIRKGTPLPKGHGKIIDADTIHIVDENFYTKSDYYEAIGEINDAPTIIEAVNREDFETVKEREV